MFSHHSWELLIYFSDDLPFPLVSKQSIYHWSRFPKQLRGASKANRSIWFMLVVIVKNRRNQMKAPVNLQLGFEVIQ